MDWSCGSNCRAPALRVWSPESNPGPTKKEKKKGHMFATVWIHLKYRRTLHISIIFGQLSLEIHNFKHRGTHQHWKSEEMILKMFFTNQCGTCADIGISIEALSSMVIKANWPRLFFHLRSHRQNIYFLYAWYTTFSY
jgi:hypothetical protein